MLGIDLNPLIDQVKIFTQAQQQTNQLLLEILTHLKKEKQYAQYK